MDPSTPSTTTAGEQPTATSPEGQGQGEGVEGLSGLYDLSTAPEEVRPLLEAELKKIVGNVGKRFESHAEYRKQWEPYEQIEGLRDVPAEELTDLLQFREIAQDPEQLEQWWEQVGQQLGFFDQDGEGEEGEPVGQEAGLEQQLQQFREELLEQIRSEIDPLRQHVTTQQSEAAVREHQATIKSTLDALREEHGDFDRDAVLKLSQHYAGDEGTEQVIRKAHEEYLGIIGRAQGELVDNKLNQPEPAITGGQPDTAPQKITSFDGAKKAALARLG